GEACGGGTRGTGPCSRPGPLFVCSCRPGVVEPSRCRAAVRPIAHAAMHTGRPPEPFVRLTPGPAIKCRVARRVDQIAYPIHVFALVVLPAALPPGHPAAGHGDRPVLLVSGARGC